MMSVVGGAILVVSGRCSSPCWCAASRAAASSRRITASASPLHPPRTLPAALNGFGLWLGLMLALTIVNYGFPIANLLATSGTAVPAVAWEPT